MLDTACGQISLGLLHSCFSLKADDAWFRDLTVSLSDWMLKQRDERDESSFCFVNFKPAFADFMRRTLPVSNISAMSV